MRWTKAYKSGKSGLRIVLIGSFSGTNAGDNAVLDSVFHDIGQYAPDAAVVIPADREAETFAFPGEVITVTVSLKKGAVRFFSFPMLRQMLEADYVFLTAGVIFGRKYMDRHYSFMGTLIPVYRIARLFNRKLKLIGYHVGVSLDGSIPANRIIFNFISNADTLIFRHAEDGKRYARLRCRKMISADNVFGYYRPRKNTMRDHIGKVGINIASYPAITEKSIGTAETAARWRSIVADIIESVCRMFPEAEIVFYETTTGDVAFVTDIMKKAGIMFPVIDLSAKKSEAILECYESADLFVGMRMHSLIFSMLCAIPVVGIAYDDKVRRLFHDMELSEYVVPADDRTAAYLTEKLVLAADNRKVLSQHIYDKTNDVCREVRETNRRFWDRNIVKE